MTSISGTASTPLPATFELNLYGVAARRFDKEHAPKPSDERARQLAAKRKAQHEVEMLALEWSKIMLEKTIHAALDPATDPALAAKLREQVINRGIGRVKEQETDADAKKQKGGGIVEFLEALTAISAGAAAIDRPTARIERDIGGSGTDGDSLQSFLDDLDGDKEEDDA